MKIIFEEIFSLERDGLVESNGRQPKGSEERKKLSLIQIRCFYWTIGLKENEKKRKRMTVQ